MVLPEELGSWRTQLQDATDQTLTLIQRGWSCGKVELTDPNAAEKRSEEKSMNTPRNGVNSLTQVKHIHAKPKDEHVHVIKNRLTPGTELRWVLLL